MSELYVLDEAGEPKRCPDLDTWAQWFETANRQLAEDHVGDVRVSTVFLGLDHSFRRGPPVLWETAIFRGIHDGYSERYDSRVEALRGHARALCLALGGAAVKTERDRTKPDRVQRAVTWPATERSEPPRRKVGLPRGCRFRPRSPGAARTWQ